MPYIGKSPGKMGVRTRFYYTATGGETSKSGADDNGLTLKFDDGEYVDVYLNGVLLVAGTDYNTSTANTIGGLTALVASDILEVIVYDIYTLAKTNSEAQRTKYYVTATGGETSISGTDDNGATITFSAGAQIDVRLNGVSLKQGDDYNTTVANTVGGLAALTAGQLVEIVVYEKFVLADMVKKSGDTMTGSLTAPSIITTSNVDVGGSLLVDTIKEGTGSVTAMTIDSTGRILTPARPAFMVYKTGTQTGVNDHISFNNTEFDIGSNWNTNYFLAPVAGVYYFSWVCQSSDSDGTRLPGSSTCAVYIEKSTDGGSNWTKMYEGNSRVQTEESRTTLAPNGLIKLAVNDRVRCFCSTSWVYVDTLREKNVFSGFLVG